MIKITGSYVFRISRENVWPLLLDPEFLLDIIPGCETLDYKGEGEYRGNIRLGMPGLRGNFLTRICTVETDPPRFCRYEGEVRGKSGSITGNAKIFLSDNEGNCQIDYQAKGIITGALSYINSRYIESIARTMINHGISKMEKKFISEQ